MNISLPDAATVVLNRRALRPGRGAIRAIEIDPVKQPAKHAEVMPCRLSRHDHRRIAGIGQGE